jgi:hypothetical protein
MIKKSQMLPNKLYTTFKLYVNSIYIVTFLKVCLCSDFRAARHGQTGDIYVGLALIWSHNVAQHSATRIHCSFNQALIDQNNLIKTAVCYNGIRCQLKLLQLRCFFEVPICIGDLLFLFFVIMKIFSAPPEK